MKRLIACASLATLTLAACGGGDVSPDQLTDALVAQGIDEELATCITDDLEARLTDDEFQTVAKADENLSGVDDALEGKLEEAITACAVADL